MKNSQEIYITDKAMNSSDCNIVKKDFPVTYEYLESDGYRLFTAILKPSEEGKFPTVIMRNPYLEMYENSTEQEVLDVYRKDYEHWINRGYAVVYQHCRGEGKSEGEFIPFIYENTDGRNLQEWIRHQNFYNGEMYLVGGSYTNIVHVETAPFADDIKGIIISVNDCNRYNMIYRNGVFKRGLFGGWYIDMYKSKSHMKKNRSDKMFEIVPFKDLPETVFGEKDEYMLQFIKNPDPKSDFWNTMLGGVHIKEAVRNENVPVLLHTAFNDIFLGGNFDMWDSLTDTLKAKSAFLLSPYDHGDVCSEFGYHFENGTCREQFGNDFQIDWIDYLRGKREAPFEPGKVTYFRSFENGWTTDEFERGKNKIDITVGEGEASYKYDPDNAPGFAGGLSCNFGGSLYQKEPYQRDDIITVYTDEFSEDVFVKGKMKAKLKVKSDCEDTAFYVRVSLTKDGKDLGIRDDIRTLCFELGDYEPNSEVTLDFTFDDHAFLIRKGEKLRIDITSADRIHYVPHTNTKGPYYECTQKKIANNTVYLSESVLTLPTE